MPKTVDFAEIKYLTPPILPPIPTPAAPSMPTMPIRPPPAIPSLNTATKVPDSIVELKQPEEKQPVEKKRQVEDDIKDTLGLGDIDLFFDNPDLVDNMTGADIDTTINSYNSKFPLKPLTKTGLVEVKRQRLINALMYATPESQKEQPSATDIKISSLTVPELKIKAKELGIKGLSGKTRPVIMKAISDHIKEKEAITVPGKKAKSKSKKAVAAATKKAAKKASKKPVTKKG
jgi:hypothetical protein